MGKKALDSGTATVEAVRQFSRFYTRRIGVLGEGLLASRFTLAEGRVIYELAQRPGMTATELITELGLDAGYLSRLLAGLARRHLVVRQWSERDGRRGHLTLTGKGRTAFSALNERSAAQVAEMISHLPALERDRLSGLLHGARQLLSSSPQETGKVTLRAPVAGDLGWVVQRHGALYAQEYGWDQTFEALVAKIAGDFGATHDSKRERCWIAEVDGRRAGCVFLVRKTARSAKLRLLLVEPGERGRGVGRTLIAACVTFAREAGYRRMELWTNSVLSAARHLYRKAGFKRVKCWSGHHFGHDLVSETWELVLEG